MRKLFSLFLALVATTLWAYAFQSGDLYYNITSSSAPYTVEVSDAVSSITSATIPETVTYNGTTYSVTSISRSAFSSCSSLASITIPNSVTNIGADAFYGCSSLTSITIPNSVTSIGEWAFYGCSSLTSIVIPNSVTSIGVGAFYGCSSLTSVTIPNGVTSIGGQAFEGCSSLTSITIPNTVTSIEWRAFYNCSSLASITIPNSVTSIGSSAFSYCSSLTSITIPNSVTSIGRYAFEDCSSLKSVTINSDAIVSKAYSDASNISHIFGSQVTEYIIGESVTSIGEWAFSSCSSLASITIPNSVTNIGADAFYGCSSLTSITIPNSVTSIGYRAFYGCSKLTKTNYTGDIAGWCNIKFGDGAANPISYSHNFYINDQEIKDLVIPNSITSIGSYAFNSCSSLTSVTIGNSVTSIGDRAFYYCSSLASVTIPNSITSIEDEAFTSCSSLTSITIPNSVTSIRKWAFYKCSSLTSITCEAETPPTLGSDAFDAVSKSIPVYVPCGCVKAYNAKSGWKDFTNIQEPLAEYSIEVNVNDNIMGSAKVDKNTACGNQISATAKYGYHFVRWSDGVTDNIRTLVLTQDTVLTAEFAINQYTITTVSSDTLRGTTKGDTTVNYLEYITISATANYGYHFSHWNVYNYDNPRQVQVTKDITYTATFDKNTYAISLSCNEGGRVEGVTSAEYLDTVTISATPNIGYHFVQWSDGVTDNPRTLVLTQDTILTAEFAQSFSGQCGDNLYWSYDETAKTISITGSGEMYDYTATTQPWLLFKEEIKEVIIANTATSIGTSAFEGCVRLAKISLGTVLEEIAANAFAGCTRLYDIYVYATYPPFAKESSFANYNAYLYIPCDSKRDYTLDPVWGKFQHIECLSNEETDVENVDTSSQQQTNCQKIIRNGQLLILRDGVEYTVMGQEL